MSDLFNKLVLRRKGTVLQGGLLLPPRKQGESPRNRDTFPIECATAWLGVSFQRVNRGISTSSPAGRGCV